MPESTYRQGSLLVVGSVAYDSIETPHGKVDRVLGGAGTYIALAASYFTNVQLVAVVGDDFADEDAALLRSHGVDLEGLERTAGKSFHWKGVYSRNLNERRTLATELNVFADFEPKLPASYRSTPHVVLGNIHPDLQSLVLEQSTARSFAAGDTMNYWIERTPDALAQTMRQWDAVLINDEEARQISGHDNLVAAAQDIQAMGPRTVIVKRGEHGATMVRGDNCFIAPGYPLPEVLDPTGAGDAFAGGFMGYLASCGYRDGADVSAAELRKAVVYGSIMGSFCCQEFGVLALRNLTRERIAERLEAFRSLTAF